MTAPSDGPKVRTRRLRRLAVVMIAASLVLILVTIVLVAIAPDLERFASPVRLALSMFIVWAALTWRFADPAFDGRRDGGSTPATTDLGERDDAVRRAADRAARARVIVSSIIVLVGVGVFAVGVFAVGTGISPAGEPAWLGSVLLYAGAIACSAGVAGAAVFGVDRAGD
ncbi:hypothetical protein [Microbacterium thalli]|uniref:Transmembrane protein n=1 Tax=Microbacterium thalli TaxID=3027921 RepID=A0ABT5SE24_9MICO|nr:hypothetical protein [Microbacterium thalli]MDD7961014.1 hypothetical protein [Microbacterium thalli]